MFTNDWQEQLQTEIAEPYFQELLAFLGQQYDTHIVYPARADLFRAFELTGFAQTKVVILGQDPYHNEGQAHGLSFSVQNGVALPPSLRNIFKELATDLGCVEPQTGDLTGWAKQGVLLLNTVLSVRHNEPLSHREKGWERFTDAVIRKLTARAQPLVFVLWGRPAQQKQALIDTSRHAVLSSPHPSPFSARRGFFGSRPFSRINKQLHAFGETPIEWIR